MENKNPFFDDLARVAGGAMGMVSGMRAEFEAMVRQQMERWIASMDLVQREEFDAVKAMAAKARDQQEALLSKIAELEGRLAALAPTDTEDRPSESKNKAGRTRRTNSTTEAE